MMELVYPSKQQPSVLSECEKLMYKLSLPRSVLIYTVDLVIDYSGRHRISQEHKGFELAPETRSERTKNIHVPTRSMVHGGLPEKCALLQAY